MSFLGRLRSTIARVRLFLAETMQELQKSAWPTKEELKDSTFVVFIASVMLGVYITVADFSVYNFISACTNAVIRIFVS